MLGVFEILSKYWSRASSTIVEKPAVVRFVLIMVSKSEGSKITHKEL